MASLVAEDQKGRSGRKTARPGPRGNAGVHPGDIHWSLCPVYVSGRVLELKDGSELAPTALCVDSDISGCI